MLGEGLDDVLAVEREGEAFFFHTDRVRSVLALTGPEGQVAARYRYSPFGEQLEREGAAAEWNHLGFTSRPQDPRSGLVDMRARAYDPELGRFLTPDPLAHEGGMNLYAYVGNNPLRFRDPLGLDEDDPFPNPFADLGELVIGDALDAVDAIREGATDLWNAGVDFWNNTAEPFIQDTAIPWIRDEGVPTAVGVGVVALSIANPLFGAYVLYRLNQEHNWTRTAAQWADLNLDYHADVLSDWQSRFWEEVREEGIELLDAEGEFTNDQLPFRNFESMEQVAQALEVLRLIEFTNDAIARGTLEAALVRNITSWGEKADADLALAKDLAQRMVEVYEVVTARTDPTWYPGLNGNYSSPPTIEETTYDLPALIGLLMDEAIKIGALPRATPNSTSMLTPNQVQAMFEARFPGLTLPAETSPEPSAPATAPPVAEPPATLPPTPPGPPAVPPADLVLPPPASTPPTPPAPPVTYTVEPGDTLSEIALNYPA